jgi:hypothetical protein
MEIKLIRNKQELAAAFAREDVLWDTKVDTPADDEL